MGLFEHREFLRKPSAPEAPIERSFKRRFSFRIGGRGGDDNTTYQLVFLFGKGSKGRSQEPRTRRVPDAMVSEAEHKEGTIAVILRAPGRELIA